MEALAALGLAGNIVQFIQFVSQLMKNTSELRRSSTGCTAKVVELETLYESLRDISMKLESGRHDAWAYLSTDEAKSFRTLLTLCKVDCAELLAIVNCLRLPQKASSGRWESFRVALLLHWNKDKIQALEARLQKAQADMTLHIFTVAR